MAAKTTVRVARNFERNLDAIREFLNEAGVPEAFDDVLDHLFGRVLPNQEFPELGLDFLRRVPGTREGRARLDRFLRRLPAGTTVREVVFGDYLLLYAVKPEEVWLLALKHHRQLAFDLEAVLFLS
jgi:plasmid stabilization system protein ParE